MYIIIFVIRILESLVTKMKHTTEVNSPYGKERMNERL